MTPGGRSIKPDIDIRRLRGETSFQIVLGGQLYDLWRRRVLTKPKTSIETEHLDLIVLYEACHFSFENWLPCFRAVTNHSHEISC
jgi:hypothetical protein